MLLVLLFFVLVMYIVYSAKKRYVGGTQHNTVTLKSKIVGNGHTILLIPGLGNGVESYNWNLSTQDQQSKTGLTDDKYKISLQDKIANLGYNVVCNDPPGYGSNTKFPIDFNEYTSQLTKYKPSLIIGHSIGARIAQYLGETHNIPYIMIDPTPDYTISAIKYTKHIDEPSNKKYVNTHKFIKMIKDNIDTLNKLKWRPYLLAYSLDDNDPGKIAKDEYFASIQCDKVKLLNATHWLHVTNPDIIIDSVKAAFNIIIHICGPSGAGKTTLMNELQLAYPNIITKDLDDLRYEFIQEHYGESEWDIIDKEAYQMYIDAFIEKSKKPLIIAGLNNMPWWHPDYYYDLHATHKFYIDLDANEVTKRKCLRFLDSAKNDKEAINDMTNNNKRFIKLMKKTLDNECDIENNEKAYTKWKNDYTTQHYEILNVSQIKMKINDILHDYKPISNIKKISKANISDVRKLKVAAGQTKFIADIDTSLIQASFLDNWHGYALINNDNVVVGFGSYASYEKIPGSYKIYKMMIDSAHQGKGYGTQLLDLLISDIKCKYGNIDVYIDPHSDNVVAKHVYSKRFDTISDDGETTLMKLKK